MVSPCTTLALLSWDRTFHYTLTFMVSRVLNRFRYNERLMAKTAVVHRYQTAWWLEERCISWKFHFIWWLWPEQYLYTSVFFCTETSDSTINPSHCVSSFSWHLNLLARRLHGFVGTSGNRKLAAQRITSKPTFKSGPLKENQIDYLKTASLTRKLDNLVLDTQGKCSVLGEAESFPLLEAALTWVERLKSILFVVDFPGPNVKAWLKNKIFERVVPCRQTAPPPPPPPFPPETFFGDLNATHPLMDAFGRAKTVRIGKWRWPPPRTDDDGVANPVGVGSFLEFKMQQQRKKVGLFLLPHFYCVFAWIGMRFGTCC